MPDSTTEPYFTPEEAAWLRAFARRREKRIRQQYLISIAMLVFWIIVGVVVYHFAPTDRIRSDWFPVALAICILGFLAWVWMNDRWRDRYRIRERVDAVQWLNAERYLRLRRYFPAHLPYLGYPRTFEWVCEASEYFDVRSSHEGSG